tara:strand:- start:16126 stop:19317 length:3192 start_codon:yes stop_codon:yes gene_type:complete
MHNYNFKYPNFLIPFAWLENGDENITSLLRELIDNGLAELSDQRIVVHYSIILEQERRTKDALNLPPDINLDLYISSSGSLRSPDLKFNFGFFDFYPNGEQIFGNVNGPFFLSEEQNYLLSQAQFETIKAIQDFNELTTQKSLGTNLESFSKIKELSLSSQSKLEEILQKEEVLIPSKIKIKPIMIGEKVAVMPDLDLEDENNFPALLKMGNSVREIYPVASGKNKVRVVFREEQQVALQNLKANFLKQVPTDDVLEKALDNPIEFFDPDIFDLEYYSDRVKELGLYKPKFYPFVSPYKSEWIPGLKVVHPTEGTKKITIGSFAELDNLNSIIDQAKKDGLQKIEWKNNDIPLTVAEDLSEISQKQLASPKKPIEKKDLKTRNEDLVLIIEENADFLGYIEEIKNLDKIQELPLFPVKSLRPDILLKKHQEHGVAWLQYHFKNKIPGCLLADDMGLGKTLQVLFFLEFVYQNSSENKPSLVVAPVSLLENWQNEYQKFFEPTQLEILTLYGGNIKVPSQYDKATVERFSKKQLILTNYETLRRYQLNLGAVDFAVVALDEAQKIKSPGTLVTNAAKALKADFKIAMTGTPVENSLVDLWCILDFTTPGLLGTAKEFAKEFQNPLKKENTDLEALGEKLYSKVEPLVMRRMKTDVAKDLPEKHIIKKEIQMPKEQVEAYELIISSVQDDQSNPEKDKNKMLAAIRDMRDVSDHPYLLNKELDRYEVDDLIKSSAKLLALMAWVESIQEKGEKVIIFADRRETQRMIQRVIGFKFGTRPAIINGETPSIVSKRSQKQSRQQTIDVFQSVSGFNTIIMSPLAAGVGLNVTEANHVIHYSRHWNPAKEDQATDRAYRIGQTKDVYVYYPLATHLELKTFDLTLDSLLDNKRSLASSTLFPTEQIEVKPQELFEAFTNFKATSSSQDIAIEELEKMTADSFEAFIAALFVKMDYDRVDLTPKSNDKGADIVALGAKNYLIQAKRYKGNVGRSALQEVNWAKKYYDNKYTEAFIPLIATTGTVSTDNREQMLLAGGEVWDFDKLKELLLQFPVGWNDLMIAEQSRLATI